MKRILLPNLILLTFLFAGFICPAQIKLLDTTVAVSKPKKPDFSHLASFPEFKTNIFGTVVMPVNPKQTQMFPKAGLFGDSSHYIGDGAKFELLNENMTPAKSHERILIKVLSNPPGNEYAGDTGWIFIQHTSLFKYYDRVKNKVDTNFLYTKYLNAAAKARTDAAATKCSANKKCLNAWAGYYDCMVKGSHSDTPIPCPYANCNIEDCPADNK